MRGGCGCLRAFHEIVTLFEKRFLRLTPSPAKEARQILRRGCENAHSTPRLNLMFERHCMHSLLLLQLQPLSLSLGSGPSSTAHRKRVMRTQASKRQAGHVACGEGVDDNRLSPMRPTRGDLHPPIIGWISQRSRQSQIVYPILTRCMLGMELRTKGSIKMSISFSASLFRACTLWALPACETKSADSQSRPSSPLLLSLCFKNNRHFRGYFEQRGVFLLRYVHE